MVHTLYVCTTFKIKNKMDKFKILISLLKASIVAFLLTFLYTLFDEEFRAYSTLLGGIFFMLSGINSYLKYKLGDSLTQNKKNILLVAGIFFFILGIMNLIKFYSN